MSKRLRNYCMYYVVLLVVLAAAGVYNQSLFRQQWRKIDEKEVLTQQLAELHVLEAQHLNPVRIRQWASSQGMVPVPEGQPPATVMVAPAPDVALPAAHNTLELQTVW